jgi:hypothetical protein
MTKRFLIAALIITCFTACKKHQLNDCFSAAGEDGVEERNLETFDQIWVGDKIDLKIIQDTNSDEKIILRGGSNLFEGIVTTIKNGQLTIDNQNVCNFVRSYKKKLVVELYLKNLSRLEVATAANVSSVDTIKTPFLYILHHAMGDVDLTLDCEEVVIQSLNGAGTILKGKVGTIKSSIEGISFLDARDCLANNVFVDSHSPLDCYINAAKVIFVKIYNSGNIYYVAEPATQKEVNEKTGEGELLLLQ